MYEVCANINNIECRKAKLLPDFQIDIAGTENLIDANSKMIWLCSPNNPTGNTINKIDIISLLKKFNGIVVLDEAYIDFSSQPSFLKVLDEYPNLAILQTFSKAWGLAALRLGMAFASKQIIEVLNKIKPPYNINSLTQDYAFKALSKQQVISEAVSLVVERRKQLTAALEQLPFVLKVHSSDANFLLVAVDDAENVYQYLLNKGIVVRNRSNATLCDNCLRITIGSESENSILLQALNNYSTVTI
jgi:histidinol-phosphate aminotransferase